RRAWPARLRIACRGRRSARPAGRGPAARQHGAQPGRRDVRDAARHGRLGRGRDPAQHHRQARAWAAELEGGSLELLLNEQQALLGAAATRLAAASGGPQRARALRNAGKEIDAEAWRAVIDAGWLATVVAEHRGGLGLGLFDLALATEQAGRRILMAPLAEAAAAAWVLSRSDGDSAALAGLLDGSRLIVPATRPSAWALGGGLSRDVHA